MLRSVIIRKHWDNLWSSKGNTFGIKQCLEKLGEKCMLENLQKTV